MPGYKTSLRCLCVNSNDLFEVTHGDLIRSREKLLPNRLPTRGVEYSRVSPTSHALLALQRMPEAHPNGVQPPSPPAGTDRATATKHLLISLPSQKGVPAFGQRALQTTGIDFTPG